MKKVDCIIIGAGLSGLAAALTLSKANRTFILIDKENQVGGRVKSTFWQNQFILDHGFQVLLSSYPELNNFIEPEELHLKEFNSGALIYNGTGLDKLGNPLRHPSTLFSFLTLSSISLKDKYLMVKLGMMSLFKTSDTPMGSESTKDFLNRMGFSQKMMDSFWTPFLAGVFLDHDLKAGKDYFLFLLKCFATGRATVPSLGMADLPIKLARKIPQESIYLNEKVVSWDNNQVLLSNGEVFQSEGLICAFDYLSESENKSDSVPYVGVTTYYFTSENLNRTIWDKWLVLIPRNYNLSFDHMCLISAISEDYSKSKPMLSVSVIGESRGSVTQIAKDINQVAGFDLQLEFISSIPVVKALPQAPDHSPGFEFKNQVIYCGDRWTSPSINGALKSGRLAAEFFIKKQQGK